MRHVGAPWIPVVLIGLGLMSLILGCATDRPVRGTWTGRLVAVPPVGAAALPMAGFDVEDGTAVHEDYSELTAGGTIALLVGRGGRVVDHAGVTGLGDRASVSGRMRYAAAVRTSDGSGWVYAPRRRWNAHMHIERWVIEVDRITADMPR